MVRDFSDEPVARPVLDQIMANATRVPSAGYSQGFAFVVLTEPGRRRLFWETTNGPGWWGESEPMPLTRAPVVIVPLAHKQAYLDRFFGIFTGEQVLMNLLGVPDGYRPIGAIAVGHPTRDERSRPELPTGRRRPSDVVRWERW